MKRPLQGHYLPISTVGEKAKAFVPDPLPPKPPIEWSPELLGVFDAALVALGRLDSASTMLPSTPPTTPPVRVPRIAGSSLRNCTSVTLTTVPLSTVCVLRT